MKRSEAVCWLAGYLSGYAWYSKKHPMELIDLAEHALSGMEKLGMAPPSYMKPLAETETPLVPGDFKNAAGEWRTPGIREWE